MDRSTIISMVSGSHLYGLNTPSSDQDFKGVFLPTRREVVLGRIPTTIQSSTGHSNQKNTSNDVDIELFSLYQFIKLACDGQTCALEMLWAPLEFWTNLSKSTAAIWYDLIANRHLFLSKNMKAFVGYARAQAAKYSLKGDRLNKLKEFQAIIKAGTPVTSCGMVDRLEDVGWDYLPKDDERTNPQGIQELQIAGKWFGQTMQLSIVQDSVDRIIARYGKRTAAAALVGGSDWKALSHALRVSLQCEELMLTGTMTLPHVEIRRDYLLKIKLGELPMEEVSDAIDESLARVESFAKGSSLPEKVDRNWWDDWLVNAIEEYVL